MCEFKNKDLFLACLFIFFGYFLRMAHVEFNSIQEDKKELCVSMYKRDPVDTMAGNFCDEFFSELKN